MIWCYASFVSNKIILKLNYWRVIYIFKTQTFTFGILLVWSVLSWHCIPTELI